MAKEISIKKFIKKMLCEFYDVFSLETICKLVVIYACASNKTYKGIVSLLKKTLKKEGITKHHDRTSIKKILELHLAPDHNKIDRLKKKNYSIAGSLLPCIKYQNFILALLQKYPYPVMVGFPFNEWTPKRIRKFLRLYFRIDKDSCKKLLPSMEQIESELHRLDNELNIIKQPTLSDIITQYRSNESYKHIYFLYTENKFYSIADTDKTKKKKSRRYNATFFCCLLNLTDKFKSSDRVYSISYNTDKGGYFYKKIFKHCKKKLATTSDILILNIKENRREIIRYYNKLHRITNMPLIVCRDLNNLKETLTNTGFQNELANLNLLQETLVDMPDLLSRDNKEEYLELLKDRLSHWKNR